MLIENAQLKLIPLNLEQLRLYLLNDGQLEKELNLNVSKRSIDDHVKDVLIGKIIPSIELNPQNWLYYTFFTIIDKTTNEMVGDICFKGPGDENREIEIGYGTYLNYMGKGYMSNAVMLLTNYFLSEKLCNSIIAETDEDNIASIKVLQKSGFVLIKSENNDLFWEKQIS